MSHARRGHNAFVTTQRGERPAVGSLDEGDWLTRPSEVGGVAGDAVRPAGEPSPPHRTAEPERAVGEGRHQWSADAPGGGPRDPRADGFDPGDTGTWRVGEVVPGAESGRRTTTILNYLLGRLAVDNVRTQTRWAYAVPVVGALLLVVRPRWIGAAVLVLGVLLVVGRVASVRLIERLSLARRFRPVEQDLRGAVEAGKANLRGELRRVGLPSGSWAIPLSVVRSARGGARSAARSRLLEIEIDRVLPRAQLDRALRVLDGAGAAAR